MKKRKRVLVYPCGTEIGLEIHKAVCYSTHFELIGGSSDYDHGRFVYHEHIDRLPRITDASCMNDIKAFRAAIGSYGIDYIYPAMDGVLYKFAQYRDALGFSVIAPEFETAALARSKMRTYEALRGIVSLPKIYTDKDAVPGFPIFIKPDVGQGSVGAFIIENETSLDYHWRDGTIILEYLPGDEYTVDCFTNDSGNLIYAAPRSRRRIKAGISVNAVPFEDASLTAMAEAINGVFKQRGGWFFQTKMNENGEPTLMEVAARIAGASAIARCRGVNLPLMSLFLFDGHKIDSILENRYAVEMDRALYNSFRLDLSYDVVYVDYDDTLVTDGLVNTRIAAFLYQCVNRGIAVILITKHKGDLDAELSARRLRQLFDTIIHLSPTDNKYLAIERRDAIFIDDSYAEREAVALMKGIPVFDTHMIECLIDA